MKINHIYRTCTRYRNRTWLYQQRRQALSTPTALKDRCNRLIDEMFEQMLVAKLNGDLMW